jgi:hypothetical protein
MLGLLSCLFSPANGEILIRVIFYVEEPDIISSPPVSQRLMAAEVASNAQQTLLVFFSLYNRTSLGPARVKTWQNKHGGNMYLCNCRTALVHTNSIQYIVFK